ncbi:MAG: DUF349 domain-containing protein [Bacteroidota bacterium]
MAEKENSGADVTSENPKNEENNERVKEASEPKEKGDAEDQSVTVESLDFDVSTRTEDAEPATDVKLSNEDTETEPLNTTEKKDEVAHPKDVDVNKSKDDTPEHVDQKSTSEATSEEAEDEKASDEVEPGAAPKSEILEENEDKKEALDTTLATKQELNSEEDLSEKDGEEEEEQEETIDYSQLSKEELVSIIKGLAKDSNIIKSDRIAREVKPFFDEIREKERASALQRFLADGGEERDFDFKYDELDNRFDANFKLIHDRKVQYVKDRELQKESNLKKKEGILERLREFVDSEDPNISFNDFKEFQNEWRAVGPVPPTYARTLWANYNALVDRFYDHRNIYFELKELDRKKNLELKLELCEKAEQLSKIDNLPEAIKALNELHHEFKHIGPVPKDEQEPLWQRFKAASDAVYDNRKDFVEQLKKELEQNLVVKRELAENIQEFASFSTDRIKAWNTKTKELLELQKKWEAVGGMPRAKAKEVNKKFWGAFKTFFHNKSAFFKQLDSQREGNLEKKRELVKQAEELKESTEWNKTADAYKKLQRQWREIGPVPEKFRESIYQEFKKACDYFFDQRRSNQNEAEKEYVENYAQKIKICEELNEAAKAKTGSLDQLKELQERFNALGFVPRRNISETKKKYAQAVEAYIQSLEGLSETDRQRLKVQDEVNKLSSGPNAGQRIFKREQSLRYQIEKIENDVSVWRNNMEFFASSSTADKLKNELQEKIDGANSELSRLRNELLILRSVT